MVTKEMVESLRDENITRKMYHSILNIIQNDVQNIWTFIIKSALGTGVEWWAFSNDVYDEKGNGSEGGEFDPVAYADFIEIEGPHNWNNDFYEYNEGFPTRFLWEPNYKEEVLAHIAKAKTLKIEAEQEKQRKVREWKVRRKELIASVKSKLTPEEMRVITFNKG